MADSSIPQAGSSAADRLAAGFLVVAMAIGCLVLWIGIPVGVLYATAQVSESAAEQFLLALPATLVAMIAFARVLFWMNRLYLRVAYAPGVDDDELEDEEEPRFARGPLETMLVTSLVVAIIALFVWFFAFAENPSRQVI